VLGSTGEVVLKPLIYGQQAHLPKQLTDPGCNKCGYTKLLGQH